MVLGNAQNRITIKQNCCQIFEHEKIDGIVMNESEVLCEILLMIYFI